MASPVLELLEGGEGAFLLALFFFFFFFFCSCFGAIAKLVLTFLKMLIREYLCTSSRLSCFCCSLQCCFV